MKKRTENKHLFSFNTFGSILTAGLLVFGAASCGTERGNEENAVAEGEEQVDESLGYEGLEDTEEVTNLAPDDYFGRWDENNDNMWDENEFETVANDAGLYNDWDADANGEFTEDELNEGVFETYDENGDGMFDENEFNTWNTAWGGEYEDEWDAWDTNDDNMLDANEYAAGVGEAGVYDDWDADGNGVYSEEEVNNGLFETWDNNDDGYLDDEEYNQVGYNFEQM